LIFPAFGDEPPATNQIYPFTPEELEDKDGSIVQTEIVRMLKKDSTNTLKRIKFLVETKNGEESAEEIMEYNELCDIVENQLEAIDNNPHGGLRTFDWILAHEGPLSVRNPKYKGSSYNLLIEWDNGELSWEPLNIIAADGKVTVALYGDANGLLEKKGWKYLKKTAKNLHKVYSRVREVLKAKQEPKFKYSARLPDRMKTFEACDAENGNTAWADANETEINLLDGFEAFDDRGEYTTKGRCPH
jgi:hypothetical protein